MGREKYGNDPQISIVTEGSIETMTPHSTRIFVEHCRNEY